MGPVGSNAAARSRNIRFAVGGTVLPIIVAVATHSSSHGTPFLAGAVVACLATIVVTTVHRRHRMLFRLAEFGGIPALTLMQSYSGGAASGYSVLVMMAMIWFGLQATRRELIAGAVLLVACSFGPMLVIGAPAYPIEWGHAAMLVLIGCSVAGTLHAVRRETLRLTRKLREEAVIDELTGLLNRRGWRHMAFVEFERAKRRGTAVALAMIDLDEFKALNDRYGHDEGDRALRDLGGWMQESFRARDTIARWGGDEFVVLLTDITLDGAMAAIGRLRDAPLRSGFSAGLAIWDGSEDLASLMQRSDGALYAAKAGGGQRTLVAAPLRRSMRVLGAHAA